jgi:hypothetical protein
LGHRLFPRIIFYFRVFFEHISLITLKKSELLYVWVTDKSKKVEIKQAQIKSLLFYLGEVVISFVDVQRGALAGKPSC